MAGIKPSFITGATAKIKAGNKTLAYAQDVNYSVTVSTIPIETMGRYEAVNHEPVAYFVEGSLSIVRYTKDAAAAASGDSSIPSAAAGGNASQKWAPNMFNPGSLIGSKTLDIEIFSKNLGAGGTVGETADAEGRVTSSVTGSSTVSIGKLRDCRLTSKGGAIDKRGILVERYSFNAILMDDDGQIASGSGDTDLSA
jgi:hypothetical protein